MIENNYKIFMFQKSHEDELKDRYFLWGNGIFCEVSAAQVVSEGSYIVCHDYWLIAQSIYNKCGDLPKSVVDLDDFRVATCGIKGERKLREKIHITKLLAEDGATEELAAQYSKVINKPSQSPIDIYQNIAPILERYFLRLCKVARELNEYDRYVSVEIPVHFYLQLSVLEGIAIDSDKLRIHKNNIEHEYYMALKQFSADYGFSLESPCDEDIIEYLEPQGFDFGGVSVDYMLDFVPMQSNFAKDAKHLRKLADTRQILSGVPFSQRRIYPMVDCFGSATSRIYYKDPSLQNLAKRHRDIIAADLGYKLSYIDYDQYEVGIMAALSKDPVLVRMYQNGDVYISFATQIFGDSSKRKEAKRLFLSYAYGMSRNALIDAAARCFGADRQKAKDFFKSLSILEDWKKQIHKDFLQQGYIGTSLGNYLRKTDDDISLEKWKRSAVSQVVQGTASLIFKRALIALSAEKFVKLKLPMHDAVLVQHPVGYDCSKITKLFGEVMTDFLNGVVSGKASIGEFAVGE